MIAHRSFSNADAPALVELWNASVSGRAWASPITVADFEQLILAKPYFDPAGLVLAEEHGRLVAFAHAGFGCSERGDRLCHDFGIVAMVLVRPSHRRRGIGRELVRRAEAYLRSRGGQVIYAGSIHPLDPFYLGLHGGSEMPGILRSDAAAHELFQSMDYHAIDESVVFQRRLTGPLDVAVSPTSDSARTVEFVAISPPRFASWWFECRYGSLDVNDFELRRRDSGKTVARARAWSMSPLARGLDGPCVGLVDVEVLPECRRQGMGTTLLQHVLQRYRDRGFTLTEVQTMTRNEAAQRLYRRLRFCEVDRGVVYRADAAACQRRASV